jgi:plasmid stability protein
MPDVLVRSVPEEVARFFQEEAKAHGRSMQQELLDTLMAYALDKGRRRRAIHEARRIRETGLAEVPRGASSDSVDLIREDRQR